MRRFLTLALCASVLFGALSSCAHPPKETESASASGTEYYETMLEERLGYTPENTVLGIGSSAEYGIDMTDFENDGYIIRTVGDFTVIFGKTADGLDMAVRKYANAVKNGTSADSVYHEGCRIERLTIAGRDISEYTVYYPADSNENVKFAADELVRLVKQATGVTLTVAEGEPVSPFISFTVSDDESLENDGYSYTVTDDGIAIEHAEKRGASAAVYRFLQNECGWDCLIYGDSFLNEAEHLDVPAGTERSETPAFEYVNLYNPYNSFKTDRRSPTAAQNSYGTVSHACHGLQNNRFFGDTEFYDQPCFTDEESYEICRDNVEKYVAARYGDPNFKEVDIAQYDSGNYCLCESCFDMYVKEGGNAGAVVYFANRLSEEMDVKYPGIIYKIFAYAGTNVPPKNAVPNDFVYVTFCFDMNCSNHKVDGTECTTKVQVNGRTNADYAKWLEGWCSITPNVYIWPYTLGTALQAYTVLDNTYDDYRYFAEIGIRGIMLETEDYGNFSVRRIEHQLIGELNWNTDMTREEFDALRDKLLEKEYGDGWEYVDEYIDQWSLSQDLVGCWQCWGWNLYGPWEKRYDTGFFRERFDYFVELLEAAESMTCSKAQENAVLRLTASMLYMGCYSSYYPAYIAGDTERIAVLSERYDRAMEIVRSFGIDPTNMPTIGGGEGFSISYAPTLEEAAWNDWTKWYDDIIGYPLPDDAPETSVILATSDAAACAELLTERLVTTPENTVLGIGSSAEYGIDMTDFENDGYIIRTVGDKTVIFGKTETGLDMAVRKYTNAVKNGVSADTIYHEGSRVERLTIAGRNISEYTVYYPADSNENVKFAVSELVRLVKQACGATLTATTGEPKAPYITFAVSDDPDLRDEGYVYTVTDDGIVFEHAEARGASAAVYRFLQNECGWDCLIYGDSFLNEAEHVDVPAGTTATETPAFDHYRIYNPYNSFKTDRKSPTAAQDGYNTNIIACHGLQNNHFFDEMKDFSSQPCYTDEDLYEVCRDNVEAYIAARYGTPGFGAVDIAAYDTSDYCFCDTCMEMFIEEGGNAGAVVRFANRLSEEMNEKYPGLVYLIFGYQGTNVPPKKAVPNDMVYVTYCFDLNCSNHTIDGKCCSDRKISMDRRANEYAKWFEGWCDITDNICVWYYTLGTALQSYTVIDNIYDDYRYFAEHNVKGLFLETENCGEFGIKRIENQLEYEMIWNTDMTREEFYAYYERLLEKEYGPGWPLVADYVEKWEYSQDIMDCWQGWGWALAGPWDKRYSTTFYRENFDEFCTLIETALSMTESKYQEDRLNRLYVTVLYMGCYSSYYPAWLEGDTERIAVLSERYERCMEIVRGFGYDPANLPTISSSEGSLVHYSPTLEEAAWSDWVEWYDDIMGESLPDDAPTAEGRGA